MPSVTTRTCKDQAFPDEVPKKGQMVKITINAQFDETPPINSEVLDRSSDCAGIMFRIGLREGIGFWDLQFNFDNKTWTGRNKQYGGEIVPLKVEIIK